MSKRGGSHQPTLFNFFTASPSCSTSNGNNSNNTNLKNETPIINRHKRLVDSDDDDDDHQIQMPVKRSRRIMETDDDSDGTTSPLPSTASKPDQVQDQRNSSTQGLDRVNKKSDESSKPVVDETDLTWAHEKFQFLKPDHIKDVTGKRPDHPNYNSRTLFVPSDFLAKQTPAMRQWWVMKSAHYDCILFFKVGKFYELYHMDAVIGVNQLGFSYMKGEFAHSGFPETAYGRMSSTLVELGYRVARVEQTETPNSMAERLRAKRASTKFDKVVRREICQITNKATRVQGVQDPDIKQPLAIYLLAINESHVNDTTQVGVCFIDTSIGIFHVGQFEDDNLHSRVLTLIAEYPPAVILQERKNLSSTIKNALCTSLGSIRQEILASDTEFWSSSKTMDLLLTEDYFLDETANERKLPPILRSMLDESDHLNRTVKSEFDLAIRCFGACIWYLKDSLVDVQLVSIGHIEKYEPADVKISGSGINNIKHMILDSNTIDNLNLLGPVESLQATLDHCTTPFGKRMLKDWICRPLCDITEINLRQEAISELLNKPDLVLEARKMMSSLPDLERQLTRIYAMGNRHRATKHPDSRAIFYEEKSYTKKKVKDFMSVLNGYDKSLTIIRLFQGCTSKLLLQYTCFTGMFSNLHSVVESFKGSFDQQEAEKEGRIIPKPGMNDDYDDSLKEINDINECLQRYLVSQQKLFGCKVSYFGNDKKRFQLEIPEYATKKVTSDYFLEGTKKGPNPCKRYHTFETKKLLSQMVAAEATNRNILQDLNRLLYEKFSSTYECWLSACHCLSALDCVISLVEYTNNENAKCLLNNLSMCIPQLVNFNNVEPFVKLEAGIHPCIADIENFVSNDVTIGPEASLLVMSGPNMGGKSTLMRQVALLMIMAQMGCHIPVKQCRMSLVDRVFTRIGAKDDIMAGQSTFLVELREACAVIKHATPYSLVLVDELGRGTSTYDGTAIAIAYLHLLSKIKCRSIFSTHYHCLMDHFKNNPLVMFKHMGCKVEADIEDPTREAVTFMYKMLDGACPKSYGFNAARLAGIPRSIINRANEIAQNMAYETASRKIIRNLCSTNEIRKLLEAMTR